MSGRMEIYFYSLGFFAGLFVLVEMFVTHQIPFAGYGTLLALITGANLGSLINKAIDRMKENVND